MTWSERAHWLCSCAAMLKTFLQKSTLLTSDDVMELLTFLSHGEDAQKKPDAD